jgi:hypothetical protein
MSCFQPLFLMWGNYVTWIITYKQISHFHSIWNNSIPKRGKVKYYTNILSFQNLNECISMNPWCLYCLELLETILFLLFARGFYLSVLKPHQTQSRTITNDVDGRNSNGGKRVNNILVVSTLLSSLIKLFFFWEVLSISCFWVSFFFVHMWNMFHIENSKSRLWFLTLQFLRIQHLFLGFSMASMWIAKMDERSSKIGKWKKKKKKKKIPSFSMSSFSCMS